MNSIFPKEIIEFSVECHRYQNLRKSGIIYNVLLASFSLMILLIPFIKIDLYTSSDGVIRKKDITNHNLIVECYVSPSELGFLRLNDVVKFQIDAFPYNQWGVASGRILHINYDLTMVKNTPMFKVICSLNETSLFLSKSIYGNLQKGMTLAARFSLAKRTLFQLLFDEIGDRHQPS
jgi:hypothetical protein